MLGFGRDLCGSPSPTPCRSRVTQSRLHSTASRRVLNLSREGDSTTSLGSLCVLGSARTGLIFTRIQEGAQPGGLTQPQPGQTEPGIPYHVPSRWVLEGGGRRGRNSLAAREHAAPVLSGRAGLFCGLFCRDFSLSVSLLLLFPLFAVLLNCLHPDSPVSACFLPILLRTAAGGGAAAWRFCCRWQPKPKHLNWCPTWGRDNGRAEQRVLKQLF